MWRSVQFFAAFGLTLAWGILPAVCQENNVAPDGFEALFNGEDLEGWTALAQYNPREFRKLSDEEQAERMESGFGEMEKFWRVENGEIVNDGEGPFLTTLREFRDYELLLEYKTVALADSGIYLKATPQVQIWDTTEEGGKWELGADKGSCGLWNNSSGAPGKDPLVLADRPFGEWNQVRVVQIGARTSVWLNGELVVDHAIMENFFDRSLPLVTTGPIQLQTHGGEIRWRNLYARDIDADECNEFLAAKNADGFETVFDGEDLEGWAGAVDSYEVADGALRCRDGRSGTVFTEATYEDFVARFRFKLCEGGNNGVAIRYPGGDGSVDTAYHGMCELQVLDDSAEKYSPLDDRQFHGSAYGKVAAHRGYLRPPGQWNFQEVSVVGSTIRVELNGSVILDCDLAEVEDVMGDNPHPGTSRTSGHFGFAGHGDPVEFSDVQIRRIESGDGG